MIVLLFVGLVGLSTRNIDVPTRLTSMASQASKEMAKNDDHCKQCHDGSRERKLRNVESKPKIESLAEQIENFKPIVQSLLHSQNIFRRKALFHTKNSRDLNQKLKKIELDQNLV